MQNYGIRHQKTSKGNHVTDITGTKEISSSVATTQGKRKKKNNNYDEGSQVKVNT